MDNVIFRYLISLVITKKQKMRLIDVVNAYLYGQINSDIYMKTPDGFNKHVHAAL